MKNAISWLVVLVTLACPIPALAQGPGGGGGRQGGDAQGRLGGGGGLRQGRGAQGREPVLGTASVRGRVVAAGTGTPLRRAQVRAQNGQVPRVTTTDENGRFELSDLPAGRWTLTAAKAGYVSLRFGQRRPSEVVQPIEVKDDERVENANFSLPKGAAISGRIADEFGDPIAGVRVQVLSYRLARGQRQLTPVGVMAQSDDTGAFRVYGLGPGEYYVSARADTSPLESPDGVATYAPTYFPGTGNIAEAQRISLGVGEEQTGAGFPLLLVRTVRVSGNVVDSSGAPMTNGIVALTTPFDSTDASFPLAASARVRGDGTFTLTNVVPGSYTLQTATPGGFRGAGAAPEIAYTPIVVGTEDLTGVSVTTSRGATINGTIVAEQGSASLTMTGMRVAAQPLRPSVGGLGQRGAQVASDGSFTLTGAMGPEVLRLEGVPRDWMVARIELGGTDVTDTAVDFRGTERVLARITLTNRVPELSGTVRATRPSPNGYPVVVFPSDSAKWAFSSRYLRTTRTSPEGVFTIRALPPDDRYLAIAVDSLDEGESIDPEFLERMKPAATSFSLREGEVKSLDLKLVQR